MDDRALLKITEAAETGATELSLSNKGITRLPPEIGLLTNLTTLDLSSNALTELPEELLKLSNLTQLNLGGNAFDKLPRVACGLTSLTNLYANNNRLTRLPPEIGQLKNLTTLYVHNNRLDALPGEIGLLTLLNYLYLSNNNLGKFPPFLAVLRQLTHLGLNSNGLTEFPVEVTELHSLENLPIGGNTISSLPKEIAKLRNLKNLYLWDNPLNIFPLPVLNLPKLEFLNLSNIGLTEVPAEIGKLTNLETLYLDKNSLTHLPKSLSALEKLEELDLEGNPLISPPPEIVEQGTAAVLTYLRERAEQSSRQWVSKLLVVGQGGVGKSSLLRALRGEPFMELETTHGIELGSVEVAHPTKAGVTMQLNTWDFGGQDIYHATHQFFLTNRSLFLLAWNARHGFEQGKLYYWLDTIQALAPDSPVLIVATHIDERDAQLPLAELRRSYPQIIGQCDISNATGAGVEELRRALAAAAAGLPLMGEEWPTSWLDAANAIRAMAEKHVTPRRLFDIMAAHRVTGPSADILAGWLHELGDILFFGDNEELNDIVIIQPQWVSEYISKVLESAEVIGREGIFTHSHMDDLWHDIDPVMRDHFLRLMERFDLSYRTLDNREVSIVVERLPLDPPEFQNKWDAVKAAGDYSEIAMKFSLSSIPAGVPTWFIARAHRFTTYTHWRSGALLAYEPRREHLALVQTAPRERYLRLTVRGANPQNFFALLKDGIELILARFPGLQVTRLIPCPGHGGEPCRHEFDYEQLLKRAQRKPVIECPESLEDVSVAGLLFGIHWSTQDAVLMRLDELEAADAARHAELLGEFQSLVALMQREFTNVFRREQEKIESHCPNVFILRPRDETGWRSYTQSSQRTLVGEKLELQLFCQSPGRWHPTFEGGLYLIDKPAEWLQATAPYLRRLVTVLKYATPLIGPWLGVAIPHDYEKHFKNDIELMGKFVEKLPELRDDPSLSLARSVGDNRINAERAEGAALRVLRKLLEEKDPQQHWGGLKKVLTPEGHYLWLCAYHAAEYAR